MKRALAHLGAVLAASSLALLLSLLLLLFLLSCLP